MKLKLDENLPASLAIALSALGHDTDTAPQENLTGMSDQAVWDAAQSSQRVLITSDLDFSDVRKFKPGTHCGIILLRLRRRGRVALSERIKSVFTSESVAHWERCFVVVTDHKVRVRMP